MTKTSRHTKTNSATPKDVVIADPNSTVVPSRQHNLDECGSANQPFSERSERQDEAIRLLAYQKGEAAGSREGHLTSFYLCQVAIECVKRVPGVERVKNETEVVYDLLHQRVRVESDGESKLHLPSSVKLAVFEDSTPCLQSTSSFTVP
jgi:hypothetical protein